MSMVAARTPDVLTLPPLPPSQAKKPRPKPYRSVRLDHPIEGDLPGQITIRVGKLHTGYQLDSLPTDDDFEGQAYKLTKCALVEDAEEPVYHVLLSRQGHSCECRGFLRHDHCKHIAALLALREAGKL
jgi:hypothetical protein